MQIYIAKEGQQLGPYTLEQLNAEASGGRIKPTDLAWIEGWSAWQPASAVPGFVSSSPAADVKATIPPPSPLPPLFPVAGGTVRLWNPNAAACWSLLLSPAFGAYLHSQNWRTLGDKQRARANMVWFFLLIIMLVVVTFVPFLSSGALPTGIGVGLLAGWYFSQGKYQVDYVKRTFPNGYTKRPIYLALLAGLLAFVIFLALLGFVSGALTRSSGVSRDPIAQALAQDVKTSVVSEWRKHPELVNATVERVSLSPQEGSSTEYRGVVDATIDGQEQHLPIKVWFDPKTKMMSWKILPKE
jgi:GYF domain 2